MVLISLGAEGTKYRGKLYVSRELREGRYF